MFDLEKPILYKVVIHTLNRNEELPSFSTFEIDREEEMTYEFLLKHISSLYHSRDMKWARFRQDSVTDAMMESLDRDLNSFMEVTRDMATMLHKIIYENRATLPSCDLAFILFEMQELMYFGCFKWNHKKLLVRGKEMTREGSIWTLRNREDLYLPNRTKVDEGFLIHLKHRDIAVIDKNYVINGDEEALLSELLLKTDNGLSEREKWKEFNDISSNLEDKFVGNDFNQKVEIKKAVLESVFENGALSVSDVVEKAFGEENELKHIYENAFQKSNLWNEQVHIPETTLKKSYEKQKILTDAGIEVNIPIHLFEDREAVEFISSGDGTWSIVIKNIRSLFDK